VIFQRSLVREFSLIAIAVVGVLLAVILTRLLIMFLGKAASGDVLPEAVLGPHRLRHPQLPAGAARHRGLHRGAARAHAQLSR
jgi:hypothetical protein